MGGVLFLDPIMQPFEAKQARASNYVSSDSRHQRADKEKKAKSLYRSRAGSHFYGTEYEIWADFGPVGNTEIFFWQFMSNF